MKNVGFMKQSQEERELKLFSVIRTKAQKVLSQDEVKEIIKNVHMNKQYHIVVYQSKKNILEACKLKNFQTFKNGNCIARTIETARVLVGSVTFGQKIARFDSGEKQEDFVQDAEIHTTPLVVLKHTTITSEDKTTEKDEIIIYG